MNSTVTIDRCLTIDINNVNCWRMVWKIQGTTDDTRPGKFCHQRKRKYRSSWVYCPCQCQCHVNNKVIWSSCPKRLCFWNCNLLPLSNVWQVCNQWSVDRLLLAQIVNTRRQIDGSAVSMSTHKYPCNMLTGVLYTHSVHGPAFNSFPYFQHSHNLMAVDLAHLYT